MDTKNPRQMFLFLANHLPSEALAAAADSCLRTRHRLHEILQRRQARKNPCISPDIVSETGHRLTKSILEPAAPWKRISLPDLRVPGMLTHGEKQYYLYIADCYRGIGEIVEIGPWLGLSTHHLFYGLSRNPNFDKKNSMFLMISLGAVTGWKNGL